MSVYLSAYIRNAPLCCWVWLERPQRAPRVDDGRGFIACPCFAALSVCPAAG
jgi:hypothetical protein